MEYYSAIKKNEILPFAATWMDLEDIMLSEISQTGNSLVVQWLGLSTFTASVQVQSLVEELRSHKLCGMAKKKKSQTDKDKYCMISLIYGI